MRNPKKWAGATAYSHDGRNDLSSSGRTEGNSSNTRGHAHPTKSWKGAATSFNHKAATPDSEAWDAIPGSTDTHPMLAAKVSSASPAYGPGASMIPTPTTGDKTMSSDASERMPKKWVKRGYTMSGPGVADMSAGKARKKPGIPS
jgi:hypothetical protein